ncbi:MAG TPA: hypothetical protein VLR92_09710 [Blastocatellia bacterium]|nr:hypothetical protein [Blastocatellia bacterium]
MSTNALLDITIGLMLMYLVLSLLCTSINEFIATVSQMRASTLAKSLAQIIDIPAVRAVFASHGLIAGSTDSAGKPNPSYLSGSTFALALLDSLDVNKPIPILADIEAAVKALPDSNVRDLLASNIATAGSDLDRLRRNLASSFDQIMDRVSGVYKRRLKWISLGMGFVVAFAINADTITVGKSLWSDSSLRAQMIQTVQAVSGGGSGSPPVSANEQVDDIVKRISSVDKQLRPMPIGWDFTSPDWIVRFWGLKLAGLMMTAVALMLGAPFWFDLLSKFMKMRGTGDKPARTEH